MALNINEIREMILNSYKRLSEISSEDIKSKSSSNKWTKKEILGHLIDSSFINYNRFLSAINKENLVFSKYPQDEYVKIQGYDELDWEELIVLWKLVNLHLMNLIENIPTANLYKLTYAHNFDQICWREVSKNEESSLSYLIKDYIGHLEHHLNQIFNY